ncbi:MAG: response regulator transcription factor [Chloroflexi bacterium]|nr:response regulator transcription factor [Chloroflexota bacterium]
MEPIRILIADDHRLFRVGLRQVCETLGGFEIVGEAENGRQAVELAQRLQPDVILMDINMPVLDGVQATRLITASVPAARVIMLTIYQQDHHVFEAIKAGARGYLLKDVDEQELIRGIRSVQQGAALINGDLATRVLEEFRRLGQAAEAGELAKLTRVEMEILRRVAEGADNKTIADQLGLSENTVAKRLSDVYQKLCVDNRTQAALVALRRGWARLEPD